MLDTTKKFVFKDYFYENGNVLVACVTTRNFKHPKKQLFFIRHRKMAMLFLNKNERFFNIKKTPWAVDGSDFYNGMAVLNSVAKTSFYLTGCMVDTRRLHKYYQAN